MEILYKDYMTFNILGEELNIISDETDYGLNTVGELSGTYYYLGNQPPILASAIIVWEILHDKLLSDEELTQIIKENTK